MSFVSREFKPYFERSISPVVDFLSTRGVHPNLITLAGFGLITLGSVALYYKMSLAALLLMGMGALLDAVDGAVARRRGLESEFGAFLDSTVDRLSDAMPFLSLGLLYAEVSQPLGVALSFTALIGSYGVSYTRARAEALGIYGIGGIFERTERWLVLLLGIASELIPLALFIITLGGFATSLQRVYEVKKSLDRRYS
ncbi:CDP-diacylglycerol--glycerol-3-phosphate 3-phosphatidyltransferase [Hydrogenivirga caldilitoris]|uniref:CDP-diacylglycerol--glycerol-3-phosphate 3-phosphatidyltransferase n=1 Tax=Hydrogenivirga caldilitoris TaxID=246264 RepID=A0A497XTF4_9AQUI|nr:CDP-alcohol phosphatidyltransferase family protein [Hydrogenivirga caldilitoris]RLJ70422.1 CDP-diacylglycerol--glycerol-3-phosphate 3-phosphatidyltransferase [Hydrogenivirga caldilitoris]